MSKFAKSRPKRADYDLAKLGVWVEVENEMGGLYGSFKVQFLDSSNPMDKTKMARLERQHGKGTDKYLRALMVEHYILDWKLIAPFEKEKYTSKIAYEYFDLDDPDAMFVLMKLFDEAHNVANFQPQADLNDEEEEATKN